MRSETSVFYSCRKYSLDSSCSTSLSDALFIDSGRWYIERVSGSFCVRHSMYSVTIFTAEEFRNQICHLGFKLTIGNFSSTHKKCFLPYMKPVIDARGCTTWSGEDLNKDDCWSVPMRVMFFFFSWCTSASPFQTFSVNPIGLSWTNKHSSHWKAVPYASHKHQSVAPLYIVTDINRILQFKGCTTSFLRMSLVQRNQE